MVDFAQHACAVAARKWLETNLVRLEEEPQVYQGLA
jgi:hypothetical protein